MEQEQVNVVEETEKKSVWTSVTPLSKYLALILFIVLPFVGFWLGYTYGPEKVVEAEKRMEGEKRIDNKVDAQGPYLESFLCEDFSGEFCHATLEVDGMDYECFLGTDESGMTSTYQTKEGLLGHCKEKEVVEEGSVIGASSWKIYRNEALGFEFKYPNNFRTENENSTSAYFVLDVDRKEYCNKDPACFPPSLKVRRINEQSVDGYIQKLNQKDMQGNDTVIVTRSSIVNGRYTKWGYMPSMVGSIFAVMEHSQNSLLEIIVTGAGVLHFENDSKSVTNTEMSYTEDKNELPTLIFDTYNFEEIVNSVVVL